MRSWKIFSVFFLLLVDGQTSVSTIGTNTRTRTHQLSHSPARRTAIVEEKDVETIEIH